MAEPISRLRQDKGKLWDSTEAFQGDGVLSELAQQEGAQFISYLGRTKAVAAQGGSKRHVVDGKLAERNQQKK